MLRLAKILTQLKPKIFKMYLLCHRIPLGDE